MGVGQKTIVEALKRSETYPHKVSYVKVEETHISWVFLTGMYAYKIKKELTFGEILDFSTLKLRKNICQKEVLLNKVLCHSLYKGVVKIVQEKYNHKIKIAVLKDRRHALEYAVKMREIPQEYRMDNLVMLGKVSLETIKRLINILVKFHCTTLTNAQIKNFGKPKFMKMKIVENFKTLRRLTTIDPKFERTLISFVKNNNRLFYKRIKEGKIREIHGDLYLKNIFVIKDKFYLYDRIEFNDSLRYADVAEDVAHLSMDFDRHNRLDLRKYFISNYVEKSKDNDLQKLINFLMCYKACLRVKVSLFHAEHEEVNKKRIMHIRESKLHLKLAESYLELL
jgi:aminoglycoside phosphotransferase family enzyme